MNPPELVFVVGCNAAGKSTFIRTRLNELEGFEILMTDVYKSRTKELALSSIVKKKNIIIETVFNDASFIEIVNQARRSGYKTSLIVLFLDSLQQSIMRVALRGIQQSGLTISGSNVSINFNESFKNVANYFLYFDTADFLHTGLGQVNQLIMSFQNGELLHHDANDLNYPKKFADYSFQKDRLSKEDYNFIANNKSYNSSTGIK